MQPSYLMSPEVLIIKNELESLLSHIKHTRHDFEGYGMVTNQHIVVITNSLEVFILLCDFCGPDTFGSEIFVDKMTDFIEKVINAEIKSLTEDYRNSLPHDYIAKLCRKIKDIPFRTANISEDGGITPVGIFSVDSPIDWNDNIFLELEKYLDIGEILSSDPITLAIKESLSTLKLPRRSSYYAAIVGPSLMGKTQTAFSLFHIMNVLYFNLSVGNGGGNIAAGETQPVYEPFRSFSILLSKAIDQDLKSEKLDTNKIHANGLRDNPQPFYTLGFIYAYLKMKNIRSSSTIKEFLYEIVKYNKALIPALTRAQFTEKISSELKLSVDDIVVFIDEFVYEDSLNLKAKLLRNLCRAVALPVILSGTNANVTNLIGTREIRLGTAKLSISRPWVKIICKLPKLTIRTLGQIIQFVGYDGKNYFLKEFIDSSGVVNYERLLQALIGRISKTMMNTVKKFMDFLLLQSTTSLPGISCFAISSFLNKFPIIQDESSLWSLLINDLVIKIRSRKRAIASMPGLLATAHILTFPSRIRENHERGVNSAKKVDANFFYYGDPADTIFDLNIRETDMIEFYRNDILYSERCYYPAIEDDILLTVALWTIWYDLINHGKRPYTLATIYQTYLNDYNYAVRSNAKVADAFSLELLAHWGICYASHNSFDGITPGIDVFKEFAINMQVIERDPIRDPPLKFNFDDMPQSLKSFLNRLSVPYLMQSSDVTRTLTSQLGLFMRVGSSDRLKNESGWDVNFDVFFNSIEWKSKGYVECKLRAQAVGLSAFYPYYLKACEKAYKISFMVVKNLNETLKGSAAIASFSKNEAKVATLAKSFARTLRVTTKNPERINYFSLLRHLWLSPKNRINIYTVSLAADNHNFEFNVLKEFPLSQGAFILIEAQFEPPYRSQYS